MNRKLYLILLIALFIGIQSVIAYPTAENGAVREPARTEKTVIDLGLATDEEFTEALESALGLEWVNKNQMPLEEQPMLAQEDSAEQLVFIEAAAEEDTEQPVVTEESSEETDVIIIVEETPEETDVIIIVEETSDDAEVIIIVEETPEETDVIIIVEETPAEPETPFIARETSTEPMDPDSLRNNLYFLESQRYAKLAEEAYAYGDYDASAGFAEEAIRYALLSDEYVARRLNGESEDSIIAALDTAKEETVKDDDTIVMVETPAGTLPLPARYTVRTWGDVKDCFWNIAGRPWVYGDPRQWRVLYDANKAKLPDPNNPNWIEPGMVLDIPSIKGEAREGTWDSNRTYEPIR